MVENPCNDSSPGAACAPVTAATATAHDADARRTAASAQGDRVADPVTDWLLERNDLDSAEFSVLFSIHKLSGRPGRAGWIGYAELCRSTGLGAGELGVVLRRLQSRGLLGTAHHPVKANRARYLLIVQG